MGAEFLKKTRESNAKCIDRSRADLGTPDLFTQSVKAELRKVIATLEKNSSLTSGAKVIIQVEGGGLTACVGHTVEAKAAKPPADILKGISLSGGLAKGVIEKINRLSNTAEISIC